MTKLAPERLVTIPLTNAEEFNKAKELEIAKQRALGYRFDSQEATADGVVLRFVPVPTISGTTSKKIRTTPERTPLRKRRR